MKFISILIFTVLCLPLFAYHKIMNFDKIKEILLHSENPEQRLEAIEKLTPWLIRGRGKEYFALLAMAFQDKDGAVASRAAHTFKLLGGETAPEFLLPLLDSKTSSARYLAAEVLGSLKCIEAKHKLIKLLDDPDPYMRGFAALALGKMRIREALPKLIHLLLDKYSSKFVRIHAAEALELIGDPKAILPLIKTAGKAKNAYVRYAAARALGNMKAKSAVNVLTGLLNDPCDETREIAKISLQKISQSQTSLANKKENSDIHISLEAPEVRYYAGNCKTRIRITNNGNQPLTDVHVHYTASTSYQPWDGLLQKRHNSRYVLFVNSTPTANVEFPGGKFSGKWQFLEILPKSSIEIDVMLDIRVPGLLPHAVKVTGYKKNTRLEINRRQHIKIYYRYSLHLSTYETEDPCEIGRQTVYVLEVRNWRGSSYSNVIVVDRLPKQMKFIETDGPTQGKYCPEKHVVIFAPFPDLPSGDKLTYRIRCKAISPGIAKNFAGVQCDQLDFNIVDCEETSIYE